MYIIELPGDVQYSIIMHSTGGVISLSLSLFRWLERPDARQGSLRNPQRDDDSLGTPCFLHQSQIYRKAGKYFLLCVPCLHILQEYALLASDLQKSYLCCLVLCQETGWPGPWLPSRPAARHTDKTEAATYLEHSLIDSVNHFKYNYTWL